MPEMRDPTDHEHRPQEKPPALGTFPSDLEVEVCRCEARRFAYLDGDPMTGWFIWPSRSKQNAI